jgi:formate-dependent nitrite reductase membrane component NrfD/ferredoxin
MQQRPDGIVDIDHDRCIGCKACMQACPYDAIYMDPVDDTAAKCHFCAHRVDRGLLPACVVVCPTESLLFGDLDDPRSRVSQLIATKAVTVRRPEQGTRPKAFYIGAHDATLEPLAARHDAQYMWAEKASPTSNDDAAAFTGARVAYDVAHPITWRWKVSAYLWTKSIAAGAAFVASLPLMLRVGTGGLFTLLAPLASMLALLATGSLLIADLKRPDRFWFVLFKPQWRSWLTRGAYLISAYGVFLAVWIIAAWLGGTPNPYFALVITVLAFLSAVYTAFLFAQCEARDLWQGPVVGLQLTIHMIVAGSATLLLIAALVPHTRAEASYLSGILEWGLAGHLLSVLLGEAYAGHASTNAAAARRILLRGKYAGLFFTALFLGSALPLAGLIFGPPSLHPLAAAAALLGLLGYEHAFVMAGQSVPIS